MQHLLKENSMSSCFHTLEYIDPEDTEDELRLFYKDVLLFLYKITCRQGDKIIESQMNIKRSKNAGVEGHHIHAIKNTYDRFAYVYNYCIIHSTVMHNLFMYMLKKNRKMLKSISSMKNLRICVLGGGPSFEATAILKFLTKIRSNRKKLSPLQVHITVVDIYEKWKIETKCIVRSIQSELCTDNNIVIDCNFIAADLTEDFSEHVRKAIKESHFVTMFKFLSEVNKTHKEKAFGVIDKVIRSMSIKSCLFFVDTSDGDVFERINTKIDGLATSSRIYGPCLYNYKLSFDTIMKFNANLRSIANEFMCDVRAITCCSAWIKIRDVDSIHTYELRETKVSEEKDED